ncbi:MAG: CvpA family protein [Chloroflexi bacterium]|nr:CvpA family protein [Chloroflexota bacterium]
MNWIDLVIVLIIIGFVAAAYRAGLIREVVTIVAVFLGIVIAGLLYDDLATDVLVFIDDADAARAIAFLILLGSVYLLGQIAAYVLKAMASIMMLGWADKFGGAAFGLLKGLIVVQMLVILFAAYPSLGLGDAIGNSEIGSFFVDDVSFLLVILPGDFNDRIDEFLLPEVI